MPKMPKWMGDVSEKYFSKYYSDTRVSEIEYFDDKLKRVRFQGETLKKKKWLPAQEIEFRINDTDYRHYTPMCWNTEVGYTDVLFYLHNKGLGSKWAENLKVGDLVNLIGPEGKFIAKSNFKKVVMIGDETSLSTCFAMQKILNKSEVFCVMEMEKKHNSWAEKIGLNAEALYSEREIGSGLGVWLKDFITRDDASDFYYFLSGNADVVKDLRRVLMKRIINTKQVFVHPYWKDGKKGL